MSNAVMYFGVKAHTSVKETPSILDLAWRIQYALGSSCSFMEQTTATNFSISYL